MPNRVAKSATDETPDFDRLRVETIRTETGGEIHVDYSDPCPVGTEHPRPPRTPPAASPVHWSADAEAFTDERMSKDGYQPPVEWFNKYVVEAVTEKDRVARQPDVTTTYTYEAAAPGPRTPTSSPSPPCAPTTSGAATPASSRRRASPAPTRRPTTPPSSPRRAPATSAACPATPAATPSPSRTPPAPRPSARTSCRTRACRRRPSPTRRRAAPSCRARCRGRTARRPPPGRAPASRP